MDKVLVIGASTIQSPLINELREQGFYVYAVSNIEGDKAHKEADEFHNISSTNYPKIKELIEQENISNAFSIGSDLALRTLCKLATHFSWVNHPKTDEFESLHNKAKVRETLNKEGISKIKCQCAKEYSDDLFDFEEYERWVIKPVDGYGSKGVHLLEQYHDKEKYFKIALLHSIEKTVIIEPFIEGKQLTIEFFIDNKGKVIPMMTVEKQINEAFVPYLYLIGHNADYKKKLIKISEALNLKPGFYNADLIETENGVELMDIAPRLGGNHLALLYKQAFEGNSVTDYIRFVLEGTPLDPATHQKNTGLYILHHAKGGQITSLSKEPEFVKVLAKDYWATIGDKIPAFTQGNQQQGYLIFELDKKMDLAEVDNLFKENRIIEVKEH